jgi:hypothetical protein
MTRRPSLAPLLLAAALVGCPGSLDDPGRFSDQFGTCPDIPMLLVTSCGTAGCHAADSPAAGLDLASADVLGRLSGTMAQGGGVLVDPSAPEASVLYTKLTSSPPFGSRMPQSGAALDDATVACVLTWIETSTKGAP